MITSLPVALVLTMALAIPLQACHRATSPRGPSPDGWGGGGPSGSDRGIQPGNRIWGVTITNPFNLDPTVASLSQLSRRVTARLVFDESQSASAYVPLVPRIHAVADVMGEILDSQFVSDVTPAQYTARAQEYLDTLDNNVDIWEVGNEINGERRQTSSPR